MNSEDVSISQAAFQKCRPGSPEQYQAFEALVNALYNRFLTEGRIRDLDDVISLHEDLRRGPAEKDVRSFLLHQLGFYLSIKYDKQLAIADLDRAISFTRDALRLRPKGQVGHASTMHNLAGFLMKRFLKEAAPSDLNEAIQLHYASLEFFPPGHPSRPSSLSSLAVCLSNRYECQRIIADLEEAITLGREALGLCPPMQLSRCVYLYNLACDLRTRFVKRAVESDLNEAIELHREALTLRPPGNADRPLSLGGLALCLSNRYRSQGISADLEEAIVLGHEALRLRPAEHPHHCVCLYNLACDIEARFLKQAQTTDLSEAIQLRRSVLKLHPPGNPHRHICLDDLACDLRMRFLKQHESSDLEEAIQLHDEALALRPSGHPDRPLSLGGIALCRSNKYDSQQVIADLEKALIFGRRALEICPPGHSYRGICLYSVACDLRMRFLTLAAQELGLPRHPNRSASLYNLTCDMPRRGPLNLDATPVLEEAIEMHRAAVTLRPASHPERASSLRALALCLADRSQINAAPRDLDEAIALEQEALQLSRHGDPAYDSSLDSLMTYLEMKTNSQFGSTISGDAGVMQIDIKRLIRLVTFETLKAMPTRMLHTHTSMLCDRDAQISHFMASQQYDQLLSSVTACDPDQRIECIRKAVLMYFQYVTLSHRWGEGEPSLRDINGHSVYCMPSKGGLKKLHAFCYAACKQGYLWVWSDTCCIDKDSSAELQEAIMSMFTWYRGSAQTIVHLSDVPNTGSLAESEWLKRGWTLQELLAPRSILFYTRDWSLYKNLASSNHKADDLVIEELTRATGIESESLKDFRPGADNARSTLQWASSRRTTRPEDIAYSLFGIFNLHLPIFYGESAENALGRLLGEIISQSGDISVLDWVGEASPFHSCFPAHITSYRALPPSPHQQLNLEEHSSMSGESTSEALQKLYDSLAKLHLPRFLNRRLILPCVAHRVTAVLLKENQYARSYTYEIQASGLRSLEVILSDKLENATIASPGTLRVVRPWHFRSPGPSARLDTPAAEWVLLMLARPFNAMLLTELPRNEFKRIASSTFIVAQPTDVASILESEVGHFDIV